MTQDPGDLDPLSDPLAGPLSGPLPGLDPEQPVPDDVGELDHPEELPPPPIEATPDDPGGDLGGEPAVT